MFIGYSEVNANWVPALQEGRRGNNLWSLDVDVESHSDGMLQENLWEWKEQTGSAKENFNVYVTVWAPQWRENLANLSFLFVLI